MTALTGTGEDLPAIERLKESLEQIRLFRRSVKKIIESLDEDDKNAGRSVEDAYKELEIAEVEFSQDLSLMAERAIELHKCEEALKEVRAELKMWEQERPRQTAINLCIAFEHFHREFLAEQLLLSPEKLHSYLNKRIGFTVDVNTPPEKDEIIECISLEYQALHAFNWNVKRAYIEIIGKDVAQFFSNTQETCARKGGWKAAQEDIMLLFQIRHQLIHRNGRVGSSYQRKLAKYRKRLHQEDLKNYEENLMPDPYFILADGLSVDGEGEKKKVDDFRESLLNYALYITEICNRWNKPQPDR
jgi:hypothetical protein